MPEQTRPPIEETVARMDPELKAKWLEALRSGKYRQAEAVLRNATNCFCCLGVLADIIDPSGWGSALEDSEEAAMACYPYMGHMQTMIGESVRDQIGLTEKQAIDLAGKNDDGESFLQIADFIEANL